MKVFLTGATGYVGHNLTKLLLNQGYVVHALVRDLDSPKIPKGTNIKVFKGDVCDYNSVKDAMIECAYVFHTAAYTNLKSDNLDDFYNVNVKGTENVMKAAKYIGVKKVIYTSTLAVFGSSFKKIPITENQPRLFSYSNDYELTKSISQEVVTKYVEEGLNVVTLNLSRVYGPGLSTFSNGVTRLIRTVMKSDFMLVPNRLRITANYVFIDDVVNAHLQALKLGKNGEKYIIGGDNISYKRLFSEITNLTKSKIRVIQLNYDFVKFGFTTVNFLRKVIGFPKLISAKVIDSLFTNRICSSQKAIEQIQYKITPFSIGLERTINHLKVKK